MIRPADTLRQRVIRAYVLFTFAVCVVFGIIAMLAVEGIEVRLVDDRLAEIAAWASPRHGGGLPVEMPAGVSFYHGNEIPLSLRGLPSGIREMTVDGVDLHVLAGRDAAGEYVVVDHESDYEEIELVVYAIVGAGFMGCLGLALLLGRLTANRLVAPVTELAAAVADDTRYASGTMLPFITNEDEVGALARAFAARTTALQQYLRRERFFTGDVSHELRTPLTVIAGAAELLAQRTSSVPELHGPVLRIQRAALEASACIHVLLLLARAPDSIDAPATNIVTLIHQEIEKCRPLVADKPVTLEYVGPAQQNVVARAELVAAALGNLLRNACQYTATGSVVVRLMQDSVSICDTGPGVPEAVLEGLRDQTFPAAPNGALPRSGSSAGAGLGLALVRRICERLGWDLEAESLAHGSCFRILFGAP